MTFGGLEAGVQGLDVCLQVAEFRLSVLEGARSRWPAIRKRSGKRNRGTIQTLGSRGSRCACGSCPHENAVFSFPVYLIGRSLSDKKRASCWPPFDIDCSPPPTRSRIAERRARTLRPRWARLPSARQTTAGVREAAKENR